MSEKCKLVTVLAMAVLCACGPAVQSSTTPSLRRIVLFNEDGKKTVGLMKDTEALTVFYNLNYAQL
jgi:hypothetical protein